MMHFIINGQKFQRLLYGRPISNGYLFLQTGARAKEACIAWFASLGSGEAFDFLQWSGSSWGVEFKYEDAPHSTRSMQTAIEDLQLAGSIGCLSG
jgi:hypothetical protein